MFCPPHGHRFCAVRDSRNRPVITSSVILSISEPTVAVRVFPEGARAATDAPTHRQRDTRTRCFFSSWTDAQSTNPTSSRRARRRDHSRRRRASFHARSPNGAFLPRSPGRVALATARPRGHDDAGEDDRRAAPRGARGKGAGHVGAQSRARRAPGGGERGVRGPRGLDRCVCALSNPRNRHPRSETRADDGRTMRSTRALVPARRRRIKRAPGTVPVPTRRPSSSTRAIMSRARLTRSRPRRLPHLSPFPR